MSRLLIALLKAYRVLLSPLLGSNCRFTPTCSQYAIEAIDKHGTFHGSWLTMRRLCRCHPWGGHGHDPVPPVMPGSHSRN
ncbi:membrane protein insertion efficiency factor YidD [Burkholderiaceae bacterium DAT-1]|nr:membrane protein insertion efficiency factor YidD [Burkholderiaceae bacterium DAT-1]